MLCCVCKARKRNGQSVKLRGEKTEKAVLEKQHFDPNFPDETDVVEDDAGRSSDRWVSTRDKMSVSEMRINYKLFDCLKREFTDPAFVCNDCYDLLEQIDALQFQANELIRDLRSRIDCHFEGGGWIGPDSPGAGASSTPVLASKRVDKRGPPYVRPSPAASSKRRFKTEPPEDTVDLDDTGGGGFMDDDDYGGSGDPSLDAEPDAGSITNTKQDPDFSFPGKRLSNPAIGPSLKEKRKITATLPDPNKRQIKYKNEFWDKANDVAYIQTVLEKKNFEFEVQMVDTISGHQHLIFDGCIWHAATFRSFNTDKYIMKWICGKGHNNSYRCDARVATLADNSGVITESKYIEHNHELDPEEIQDALLRNSVREIALNHPEMTPIRVFKTVQMMNEGSLELEFTPRRQAAYLRYISRLQDKHGIPRKPRECKPENRGKKRKKPLDKWKKTPSQIKAEAEEAAAAEAAEAAAMMDQTDETASQNSQVQHIIIQQGGAPGQVIVQQTNADGSVTVPTTAYARGPNGRNQAFQIEYTGHVTK